MKIGDILFFNYLCYILRANITPSCFSINRYAKEDASDEEMTKAAEQANCRKFIENNEFGKKIVDRTKFFPLKI